MSEREFFEPAARDRVRRAIEEVESETSAELVVVVRRQSASYRQVDVAVGSVTAFALLMVILFHPWSFPLPWIPLEVLFAFLVGYGVSSLFWGLKRALLRHKTLRQATWQAACAAFHEKGVSRTSGRNGLLVYVSMLERRVECVTDIGIDTEALGSGWSEALAMLRRSVARRPDLEAFATGLEALGPILGAVLPRAQDDVNELPDELDAS